MMIIKIIIILGKKDIKELQGKNSHIGHCTHISGRFNVKVKVKVTVKQARYRPGVVQRVPGS